MGLLFWEKVQVFSAFNWAYIFLWPQMHPRGGYMSVPSADPTPPHTGPPVRRAGWRGGGGGGGGLDEGGFEYQGEKTRFATLQKQRLFAELRSTKTKNQVQ